MRLRKQSRAHSRRGAALITSLIVVMVIASLGATLIHLQSSLDKRHSFAVDRRRALYIAEAGIAEATLAIAQGKSGIIGSEAVPASFGRGVYWVDAVDLPDDRMALVCTGQIGSAEFVLRTIVVPNLNPVAELGFFGTDGVNVGWGTVADGYHSGEGSYLTLVDSGLPVTSTGEDALVGSNKEIFLSEVSGGLPVMGVTDPTGTGGTTGPSPGGTTPTGPTTTIDWGGALSDSSSTGDMTAGGTGGSPSSGTTGGTSGGSVPSGSPTRIYGMLRPGKDELVVSNGFSEVVGSITPFEMVRSLPPVTLPSISSVVAGPMSISSAVTGISSASDVRFTGTLEVASGGTLTLQGPAVLDVDVLRIASGGTLNLDDSTGPIQIYVRQMLDCVSGSTITSQALTTSGADSTARGVGIFIKDIVGDRARVVLECTGTFRGIFYAPSDSIRIPTGLRFVGSAVARHLTIEDGAHVTHDKRLSVGGDGVAALPNILSWQIVPIGDGLARQLNLDPLLDLALRGVTPTASSESAPESNVEVQYIDLTGSPQTYSGPITALNLTLIQRVVGVRWDDPRDGTPREWLRPAGEDPTDAVDQGREEIRLVRTVLGAYITGADVGTLTDAQTVDLISTMPADAMVGADANVVNLNDRVTTSGAVDVTSTTATFDWKAWQESNSDVKVEAAPTSPTMTTGL